MQSITGDTKIIGFFGSTYQKSKLYSVYNKAFSELSLDFVYVPFPVKRLKEAVLGVRNLGIHALGVTIPYKIEIMEYLDEIDDMAQKVGAVNVVLNEDGKLIGGNTDGIGAIEALKEQTTLENKKVLLLGAGGAARAIAFALYDEGLDISILNRNPQHAEKLAQDVGKSVQFGSLDDISSSMNDVDIIINATPYGMAGTDTEGQSLVPQKDIKSHMVIMDIITKPTNTQLLQYALSQGAKVVYGDRMLLFQGIEKFYMYTGKKAPIEIMEKAMNQQR